MGRAEIAALIAILQTRIQPGEDFSPIVGTRHIHFDETRDAFVFDKCEAEGYCQERPAVVSRDGRLIDPGGPLFADDA